MATLLQILKETGARISEALRVTRQNIDTQRKTINIVPSKGSNPRILPISDKLLNMLNKLPRNKELLFAKRRNNIETRYLNLRKRVADTQQNPRILQIHFHTFRHWKGTMEYHKTKDIMHVKYTLGHKAIQCTMTYINIEQAVFLTENTTEEFSCKTAHNITEAIQLIENGFQYVVTIDGQQLFKKRK
jgi:integrase